MEILQTPRLVLRTFEASDFAAVFIIYKNPETCKYLLFEPWTEQDAQQKFMKKVANNTLAKDKTLNLAVVFADKVIGDLSVWYTDMRNTMEIGYSFNAEFQGKGLATEALSALAKYLFSTYAVHRIQANLDARNSASARLCARIGMRREAHFIQDFWNKGEWTSSFIYGMLIEDIAKQP